MIKEYLANKVKEIYKKGEDFYNVHYYLPIKNIPIVDDERLDMENFEWLEISDDKIVVCCGGDWQEPMTLTIKLDGDNLLVVDYKDGYIVGLSENEFNQLLFDTIDYDEIN